MISKTIASITCGLVLVQVLAGCGSSPKKDDDGYSPTAASADSTLNFDSPDGAGSSASKPNPAASGKAAPSAAAVSQSATPSQGTLVDAIKGQNDDQIARVAGQLLTQNPNDARALNAMAMTYFRKGKVDAAKFLLNKALVANPNAGEVHNNMGLIYLANNEPREAIKSFRKALDLNPNDGIAAANAGSIYVTQRDYNKAATVLEVAQSHGVRDVKTMNNYAVAL
ncbi:MAG: tetratricopeptide repeat protein, partial [Proteobacteria bacterium]